ARLRPATPRAERVSREAAAPPSPVAAPAAVETPSVAPLEAQAAAGLESLTMPDGGRLSAKRLETPRDRLFGNMYSETLPAEGLLFVGGEEVDGFIWQKNTLVPWDYVITDSKGAVTQVITEAPPSPPDTPWGKVGLLPYHGSHSLTLPAGEAARRGLKPGVVIPELAGRVERREVPALAAQAMSGESGMTAVLDHFANMPDAYSELEDLLVILRREGGRDALARFYDGALSRPEFRRNFHEGTLSRFDLSLWAARTHPNRLLAVALRALIFWPKTFVHESGHYLAYLLFGVRPRKFRVFVTGGGFVQAPEGTKLRPWQQAFVSAAGPLLQLVTGLALMSAGMPAFEAVANGSAHAALDAGEIVSVLLGYLYALTAVPSGSQDIPDGAWALGHRRFSAEMNWRRETGMFGGTYRILGQMLVTESAGTEPPGWRNEAGRVLGEGPEPPPQNTR
ncbi:MAG: M50 family metallopeptidase, partial [Elusimicrobiota bacterium]|nr:M50 family metallopeptidase [Elusimicrobiota bacterium]